MLLRGVYTFEPRPEDHDHTLAFTCNDNLIFLDVLKRDVNWIKVADIHGRIGYVPKNFTKPEDNVKSHDIVLTFLADAVVKARQNNLPSVSVLENLRDEIREYPSVVEKTSMEVAKIFRSNDEEPYSGRRARRTTSDQTITNHTIVVDHTPSQTKLQRIGSDLDLRMRTKNPKKSKPGIMRSSQQTRRYEFFERDSRDVISDSSVRTAFDDKGETGVEDYMEDNNSRNEVPSNYSLQEIKSKLLNVVQETSGLDPKLSEHLLIEVFQRIKESTSNLHHRQVDSILNKLAATPAKVDRITNELEKCMENLSKFSKEGIRREQRPSSGRIGNSRFSQPDISEKLDKLRKLLIECDPLKVTQMLQAEQHAFSQDMVHLYHPESPVYMKEKILDIFLLICTIDKKGRNVLLATTLPLYLAREIMAGERGKRVFKQQMDLLISLLTCGETMPETHFEIMGTGFVHFLQTEIEVAYGKGYDTEDETIPFGGDFSSMINLLLAYNLQFEAAKENIVLKVLAENRKRPKGFFSVLIDLFKKNTDPLSQELEENGSGKFVPNSVFKMVSEICLCQRTQAHLTTRDKQDLLETIRDGLIGIPAGRVRLGYIQVLQSLLSNVHSNLRDIRAALLSILLDSDPLAISEQNLIRAISKEFPSLFMRTISRIRTNVESSDVINYGHQDECFYLSS